MGVATLVALVVLVVVGIVVIPVGLHAWSVRNRRDFGTDSDQAAYRALHLANLAAPALRSGLTEASAQQSVRHLRALLGSAALAITDQDRLLAWEGTGAPHAETAMVLAAETLGHGVTRVAHAAALQCGDVRCALHGAVVVPLSVEDRVVGTLTSYAAALTPGLVRATEEVGVWVSTQLDLAELQSSRSRAAEAELRALRAQISPHFIYNALTAIASFVRTDPARARELLLEFADFTRYSFRSHAEFTSLAEELRCIDRYLLLERARFGDRLEVSLQVAPEVLPVAVPALCLQPLVENAVRHGLEARGGIGRISIIATDVGSECHISIEDDGQGMDPALVLRTLTGVTSDGPDAGRSHIGLANVDERMRQVFGDAYGLIVETAPGAGTRVSLRVPKFHEGVRAS